MNSKKKIVRKRRKISKKLKGGKTDKCSLEMLIFGGNKCGTLKSNCNITHLNEKMEYYKFFKAEKNKNFVENYLKKFTLKFVGKDQKKIENLMIILECLPSVGKLHVIFYKIYKTDTSPDSENFKSYVSLKEKQKDETFLDPMTNNEKKSTIFKEQLTDISITLLVDFIVEVIIESILTYEEIQKKEVKLDFKKQFETFIKNTDTNQEIGIGLEQGIQQTMQNKTKLEVGNGTIMTHYIELKNLVIKKSVDTAPKAQKKMINDLYDQKKTILKTDLINHYKAEKTQKIIENLHSIGIMDTQDEGEKLIESMIGQKQSPKYLFIVLGLVGFAVLLKFNVLAGSPITGSGTL
jgi:hypothetical protein